jgi:2-aminoethylphosphonate-pyruvate transaminase
MPTPPSSRDKLLFTPGPLTTSLNVKARMLHDAGSWHAEFNARIAGIRAELLAVAGVSREAGWETILMQGSGTFGVEAVFQTCVPPDGKVAVLSNGAYGERMAAMLTAARIPHAVLRTDEDAPNDPAQLDALLGSDRSFSHVAVVHCETTTGILNPIAEIGRVAKRHGKIYVVDAMSSFAAYPEDWAGMGVDFLISSANKCIEGVPGFSFVLGKRARLVESEGWARSLSLNLLDQLKGFEKNGQFRYTPPTHSLLAFEEALRELRDEGGPVARADRYRRNHATLVAGAAAIGLRPFLNPAVQSHIITSFYYPDHPEFDWMEFYNRVAGLGCILYPGKLTRANTFRVGNIGRLFEADMVAVVNAMRQALSEMGVPTHPIP